VISLKSRITSLEASNRDTLALLESKSAAHDKLAEELSAQHKKAIELRRELSAAEQNIQNANSASASARFREQNLQQELELTKKNNEWYETELKTKSAEHSKFRKEKSARISELQRENEEANLTIETLRRTENSLKSRLDEIEQRYEASLATITKLKEEAIQVSETFRIELDSSNRLAELQGSAAQTAKQRVQECQLALEKTKDDAAEQISRLRIEMESEHLDKEAAEKRVAELEATISQLQSDGAGNRSTSPARSLNGLGPSTPMRPGTPGGTFSPRASRTKGGLTLTQTVAKLDKVQMQLFAEQRTNQELRATVDEMVQELESSKPEIDELRADHGRLEVALLDMTKNLDTVNKEREEATKEARRWQGQVEGLTREGSILRQQLHDISATVKVLLLEVALAKHGEDYDHAELEEIARKQLEDNSAELNATGRWISENVTTFKNLNELQQQNLDLRRMLRELGDKLESEEAREKTAAHQREQEELKELRTRCQTYRDEINNLLSQIKSYVKERDTFKSILSHRRQIVGDPSALSQSMPLGAIPPGAASSQSGDMGAPAELLRSLQAQYDTYREEMTSDHAALRQQINELSRKNSELLSEISRSSSQLAGTTQRAELLQNNFNMLKTENSDLQKRYSALFENANRQDIRTQQAAEDLVEAKGLAESLQRENANLKAEKDLWKSIEKRLQEDVENLRNERSRLDSYNANLQTMLNEREHTDTETRRRLQSSVETLESELHSTKRQLNTITEESKQASLRRVYEQEQSQKRIDDLVTSLGSVREELVAIKTTKDHLQSRVDELTVELKSAEERLQVVQSRPSVSAAPAEALTTDTPGQGDIGLSREQELAIEVSELKRDLDLARGELAHAKEQAQEYQAISQSTEERMEAEAETNAQYREETDRLIEEKDKKINDLEVRVEEVSSELSATNAEILKVREEQSEATRHLEEQKTTLEFEITRLKDDNERHIAAAQFHQEDLKAQAEIAQHAQQNYETELVRHAEAAKTLQTVRAEANQMKLEITELRSQSDNYKKDLAQKEESWVEQRARYEGELAELHKRREEVLHQNSLLHTQLENITTQISSLKRDRANVPEGYDQEGEQTGSNLEGLQEVIHFLRQEKQIVDVQLHLSEQEGRRLRQQLDYTQSQLDETRLKLEQQRRATADSDHNALNHNKLMETLNELNLFRESNVTLRSQVKQTETSLTEKSALIDELRLKIEPLEAKIVELESIVEGKDGEMQILQADRDRYQQRVQNILQKYDRVDPAEMEALNEKIASLEKERDEAISARDEAVSARDALQTEVDSFPEQLKSADARLGELRTKLTEQFKGRSKELSGRINSKQQELNVALQEKEVIQEELNTTKAELEALKAKVADGSTAPVAAPMPAPVATPAPAPAVPESTVVNPTPASQFPTSTTQVIAGDEQKIKALEEKIQRLEAALAEKDGLLAAKDAELDVKIKERADRLKEMFNNKLAEVRAAHSQEIEKLSSGETTVPATPGVATDSAPATPSKPSTLPELTDAQARELVSKNETIRTIVRNNIRNHIAKEKEKIIQEAQASFTANDGASTEIEQKFNEEMETLKRSYEAELEEKVKSARELSDKKSAARISMLDTRIKTAQAKIEVVQKAASETPQKPVVEVWEVAKTARPPAATPKPAALASPAPAAPSPAPSPAPTAAPTAPPAAPAPAPIGEQAAAPAAGPAGVAVPESTATDGKSEESEAKSANTPANPPDQLQQNNQTDQASSLPNKPPPGTAPATLKALQSGLPVARGGRNVSRGGGQQNPFGHGQQQQGQTQGQGQSQRGTGLPRGRGGRGGGQGRGGHQNAANVQNQAQTPTANRGGLNVQARQFVPQQGNKRGRDENSDVPNDGGSGGKRMRGGGGQARGGASS